MIPSLLTVSVFLLLQSVSCVFIIILSWVLPNEMALKKTKIRKITLLLTECSLRFGEWYLARISGFHIITRMSFLGVMTKIEDPPSSSTPTWRGHVLGAK
jgi:hypothetical protein